MTQQTRDQRQAAIKMVSLALWGLVFVFVVLAGLFLLNVIPSESGALIGGVLLGVAVVDSFCIKFFMAKMQANLEDKL